MSKKLLILGAGEHGKVVREVALSITDNYLPRYSKVDFLDDYADNAIGKIKDLENYVGVYEELFCGIGNNSIRKKLLEKAEILGYEISILVHPTAYISSSAVIGKGTVVEPKAIVNTNSIIGKGSVISVGAIIDYDVLVGKYVHVNAGAICKAGSKIQESRKVNAGEIIPNFEKNNSRREYDG